MASGRLCVLCIGCEYGDRSDWCSTLRPSYCYTDSYQCCHFCADLYNQSSGLKTLSAPFSI